MKILFVAATSIELNGVLNTTKGKTSHTIEGLVTGVGMTATAFALGKHLAINNYDLAINVGLVGSFKKDLELGELVNVIKDQFSEEGAEDDKEFLSLQDIGLRSNSGIFEEGLITNDFDNSSLDLKMVSGITVNTVHGNDKSIEGIVSRLNPDVESMEGAAFLYACKAEKLPCLQIRAISNYVEKRNRTAWKIDLALDNLANEINSIISQL